MKVIEDLKDLTSGYEVFEDKLIYPDLLDRKKLFQDNPMLIFQPKIFWTFSVDLIRSKLKFYLVEGINFVDSPIDPENKSLIDTITQAKSQFPEVSRFKDLKIPSPRYKTVDPLLVNVLPRDFEEAKRVILEVFPETKVSPLLVSRLLEPGGENFISLAEQFPFEFGYRSFSNPNGIVITTESQDGKRKFQGFYNIRRNIVLFNGLNLELESFAKSLLDPDSLCKHETISQILSNVKKSCGISYLNAVRSDFSELGEKLLPIGTFLREMIQEEEERNNQEVVRRQRDSAEESKRSRIANFDAEIKRLQIREEEFLKSQKVTN